MSRVATVASFFVSAGVALVCRLVSKLTRPVPSPERRRIAAVLEISKEGPGYNVDCKRAAGSAQPTLLTRTVRAARII